MEKINVNLGTRSYVIRIGSGLLDRIGGQLQESVLGSRIAVITNSVVRPLYGEQIQDILEASGFRVRVVEIADGEIHKTLATAERLYDELIDFRMDRTSAIVALGGGVIGDLAGFTAATYMRGIPFINIPTTLLAQVDSAIGGKTGVDHPKGKNLIGAFYQPRAVFCDLDVLQTLPEKELIAGMAEVVKYGVIVDANFFSFLESHLSAILQQESSAMMEVIRSSCEVKAHVVEEDEREAGLRAILNYGHTLGHTVESLTGYSRYIHGEAVSMGMVAAAKIAREMGLCDAGVVERIATLLQNIGLPVRFPEIDVERALKILSHDKKVRDGKVRFVLPERIGKVVIRDDVPPDLIRQVLQG